MKPWETRTLEGLLVIVGAAVLAFGGFVAAYPGRFGTFSDAGTTSTGPVTLAHLTTVGTTPTVVTEVTLTGTSSHSTSRSTSDAWLGTILGIGTLIILSGAMYRRVASVSGFGMNLSLSGVVNDPQVQAKVASTIAETNPNATPQQAALIYANTMGRLESLTVARTATLTPSKPKLIPFRFSGLAEPDAGQATRSLAIPVSDNLKPTDDEIAKAVEAATAEVIQ